MPMLPWIALLGMLLALPGVALARDDGRYSDSQYKAWFSAQRNAEGQFCCSDADGNVTMRSVDAALNEVDAYKTAAEQMAACAAPEPEPAKEAA